MNNHYHVRVRNLVVMGLTLRRVVIFTIVQILPYLLLMAVSLRSK